MSDEERKRLQHIEQLLGKVRPYIRMHGGDVFLLGVDDGSVRLKISGACAHCSLADLTYNKMLGKLLIEEVPGVTGVILDME